MRMDYEAPVKQMEELIRLSESCTQEFQWDCYFAPLEIRNEKLLVWSDRTDTTQSYYYGNGTENQSICQCSTTNTCKNAFSINFGCNCNSRVPVTMQDFGMIDNMEHLPILGFSYKASMEEYQNANLTLNPLKCKGTT